MGKDIQPWCHCDWNCHQNEIKYTETTWNMLLCTAALRSLPFDDQHIKINCSKDTMRPKRMENVLQIEHLYIIFTKCESVRVCMWESSLVADTKRGFSIWVSHFKINQAFCWFCSMFDYTQERMYCVQVWACTFVCTLGCKRAHLFTFWYVFAACFFIQESHSLHFVIVNLLTTTTTKMTMMGRISIYSFLQWCVCLNPTEI